MTYRQRLGARIRAKRKAKGFSQQTLAQLCERSTAQVYRIEAGKCFPGGETLMALAHHLGTTTNDLLDGLDDAGAEPVPAAE